MEIPFVHPDLGTLEPTSDSAQAPSGRGPWGMSGAPPIEAGGGATRSCVRCPYGSFRAVCSRSSQAVGSASRSTFDHSRMDADQIELGRAVPLVRSPGQACQMRPTRIGSTMVGPALSEAADPVSFARGEIRVSFSGGLLACENEDTLGRNGQTLLRFPLGQVLARLANDLLLNVSRLFA